jgi:hypothetical protein
MHSHRMAVIFSSPAPRDRKSTNAELAYTPTTL